MVQLKSDNSKLTTLSYSLNSWCNSPVADKHTVASVEVGKFSPTADNTRASQ